VFDYASILIIFISEIFFFIRRQNNNSRRRLHMLTIFYSRTFPDNSGIGGFFDHIAEMIPYEKTSFYRANNHGYS